jgi:hypothetical protein
MKRLIGSILVLVSLPLVAAAQGSDYSKGHGYFYVAPGVRGGADQPGEALVQIGGGAEAFFTRNLGLGFDVGGLRWFEQDWFYAISPNFVVRFRAKNDENRVEPFLTGGGTVFTGVIYENGLNLGGGVNYWFSRHVGLRLEARDSFELAQDARHFVAFRIGLTFR